LRVVREGSASAFVLCFRFPYPTGWSAADVSLHLRASTTPLHIIRVSPVLVVPKAGLHSALNFIPSVHLHPPSSRDHQVTPWEPLQQHSRKSIGFTPDFDHLLHTVWGRGAASIFLYFCLVSLSREAFSRACCFHSFIDKWVLTAVPHLCCFCIFHNPAYH
jgi:hypothetical protein